MLDQESKPTLSHETKITIGLVIALIGACLWINNKFNDLNFENQSVKLQLQSMQKGFEDQLDSLRVVLNQKTEDRYTKAESAARFYRLAILNPGLKIPDPENPHNIIEVSSAKIRDTND